MAPLVLIADDDASMRLLLREVLEDDGFAVVEARDGADALARIRQEQPDVLLLDLLMPRMTGWEVIEQLKQMQLDLPVGIMSGARQASCEADRLGAAAGLQKPFTVDAVLTMVERLTAPASTASRR